MYNVAVSPTDVIDDILTLTIDNVGLMYDATYNVIIILNDFILSGYFSKY